MNCTEQRECANDFIDGELEARHHVVFFKHLGQCAECQSFMDVIIHAREAQRREQIVYPNELDDRVLSSIMRMRPRRSISVGNSVAVSSFWGRPMQMRASLVATVAVGLMLMGYAVGGWVNQGHDANATIPATSEYVSQVPGQPTKIIVVYSLPPVEVHGSVPVEPAIERQIQY